MGELPRHTFHAVIQTNFHTKLVYHDISISNIPCIK